MSGDHSTHGSMYFSKTYNYYFGSLPTDMVSFCTMQDYQFCAETNYYSLNSFHFASVVSEVSRLSCGSFQMLSNCTIAVGNFTCLQTMFDVVILLSEMYAAFTCPEFMRRVFNKDFIHYLSY